MKVHWFAFFSCCFQWGWPLINFCYAAVSASLTEDVLLFCWQGLRQQLDEMLKQMLHHSVAGSAALSSSIYFSDIRSSMATLQADATAQSRFLQTVVDLLSKERAIETSKDAREADRMPVSHGKHQY